MRKKHGILLLVICILMFSWLVGCGNQSGSQGGSKLTDYDVTLNERDVAVEVGQQTQLQIVPNKEKYKDLDVKVSWLSEDDTIVTVNDSGLVTGVAAGETIVKAVVTYGGQEYSATCTFTVKTAGEQYSTYKVRHFVQKKDRSGYDMTEETFERLVGTEVSLSIKDATKGMPANYQLNKEKSVLSGKVQERQGACVLEVYEDVAKIAYTVNYYTESATKLGTYVLDSTKTYKDYAFSPVRAETLSRTGYTVNSSAKGSRLSVDSVVPGTTLKVYYDRIRSKVTISYVGGRPDAVYNCVYGVGLQGAPSSALSDTLDILPLAAFVDGKETPLTSDYLKSIRKDTHINFQVKGAGFVYDVKTGALVNNTTERAQFCYVYLNKKDKALYLAGTYNTTGSTDNMLGVTVRRGGTSREIRFQSRGIAITKNQTNTSGILAKPKDAYYYNWAGRDDTTVVFAQSSSDLLGSVHNFEIYNKFQNTNMVGGSYRVEWVLYEGILYCRLDGVTVVRLPLTLLEENWTADKEYEIGFSTWDGASFGDAFSITDIKTAYGTDAVKSKAKLVTDRAIKHSEMYHMIYDPLSGSYIPASSGGSAYVYGKETAGNTGISAKIQRLDPDNNGSRVGVTIKMGDETNQYVIGPTLNNRNGKDYIIVPNAVFHEVNYTRTTNYNVTRQIMRGGATSFDKNGACQVTAMVKDNNFYLLFNNEQVMCVKMQALFTDYTPDKEVSVGLYTYDACNGLVHFENVKELSENDINSAKVTEYKYWSEWMNPDDYSFENGTMNTVKVENGNGNAGEYTRLLGFSKDWDVSGKMVRTDENYTLSLPIGIVIQQGVEYPPNTPHLLMLAGYMHGFLKVPTKKDDKGNWVYDWSDSRKYIAGPVFPYVINTANVLAFNGIEKKEEKLKTPVDRTKSEISFRAVIHDNILYMFFDGELCWRIPLTDKEFGGFDPNQPYTIQLRVQENYSGSEDKGTYEKKEIYGGFKDINVKMGYEVTGNKNLIESLPKMTKAIDYFNSAWNVAPFSISTNVILTLDEHDVFDESTIPVTNIASATGRLNLKGKAKTWEISGSFTREDKPDSNQEFSPGIMISDSKKDFYITGLGSGIRFIYKKQTDENSVHYVDHWNGNTPFSFNPSVGDFFTVANHPKREIFYRFVIKDDVFYAWFGDNADNLTPSWMVPLDEPVYGWDGATNKWNKDKTIFEGFASDSDYTLSLYFNNGAAPGAINITKLASGENVDTSELVKFARHSVKLDGSSTDWDISGTMKRTDENIAESLPMGIVIKQPGADASATAHSIMLLSYRQGFLKVPANANGLFDLSKADATYSGGLVFPNVVNVAKVLAFNGSDKQGNTAAVPRTSENIPFRTVIYDGILYMFFDGELCWRVPLTDAAFGGFDKTKPYTIELRVEDYSFAKEEITYTGRKLSGEIKVTSAKNGDKVTKNTSLLASLDKMFNVIDKFNSGYIHVPFSVSTNVILTLDENDNFNELPIHVTNIAKKTGNLNLKGTFKTWEMSGSFTRSDGTGSKQEFSPGIKIEADGKQLNITGLNKGIRFFPVNNVDHWNGNTPLSFNPEIGEFFDTQNHTASKIHYRFVIKDDVFYAWFGDSEENLKPSWMVPLDEPIYGWDGATNEWNKDKTIFEGFARGSDYTLTIFFNNGDASGAIDIKELASGDDITTSELDKFPRHSVKLDGSSTAWDISGKMKRTDKNMKESLPMGFVISQPSEDPSSIPHSLMLLSYGEGFLKVLTNNKGIFDWNNAVDRYSGGVVFPYVVNSAKLVAFTGIDESKKNAAPRTKNEISFRAVIKDGIFYMFFDKELCWRVPLTEEQFGQFDSNKPFTIELRTEENYKFSKKNVNYSERELSGGFDSITSKTGEDVTNNEKLSASLVKMSEAIGKFDHGVDSYPWSVNTNVILTLGDDDSFNDQTLHVTNVGGKTSAMNLKGSFTTWEISGSFERFDEIGSNNAFPVGLQLDANEKTLHMLGYKSGIHFVPGHNDSHTDGNTPLCFNPDVGNFFEVNNHQTNEIFYRFIIKDDVFYAWFGDSVEHLTPSWRVQLDGPIYGWNKNIGDPASRGDWDTSKKLFDGFAKGSSYQVSIYFLNNAVSGVANITTLTNTPDIDPLTTFPRYQTQSDDYGQHKLVDYNAATGYFKNESKDGKESLLRVLGSSTRWEATGKVTLPEGSQDRFSFGPELRLNTNTDKVLRVKGHNNGYQVGGHEVGGGGTWPGFPKAVDNIYFFNQNIANYFGSDGNGVRIKFTFYYRFLVDNDVLYMWFGDAPETLILSVKLDLTKDITTVTGEKLTNFEPGTRYLFGLSLGDPRVIGEFSDTQIKYGSKVSTVGIPADEAAAPVASAPAKQQQTPAKAEPAAPAAVAKTPVMAIKAAAKKVAKIAEKAAAALLKLSKLALN